jgi:hypothetical protein
MGSMIEINDTLQLTTEQGFPVNILSRERHCKTPVLLGDVADEVFEFQSKPNPRIFQLDPVRVYFVHNIDDKWLFWGHAMIQSLTINKNLGPAAQWKEGDWVTSGTYKITEIYDPDYQKVFTMSEAPPDRNYFR